MLLRQNSLVLFLIFRIYIFRLLLSSSLSLDNVVDIDNYAPCRADLLICDYHCLGGNLQARVAGPTVLPGPCSGGRSPSCCQATGGEAQVGRISLLLPSLGGNLPDSRQ